MSVATCSGPRGAKLEAILDAEEDELLAGLNADESGRPKSPRA